MLFVNIILILELSVYLLAHGSHGTTEEKH